STSSTKDGVVAALEGGGVIRNVLSELQITARFSICNLQFAISRLLLLQLLARAQHFRQHFLGLLWKSTLLDRPHGFLDWVFDALELDLHVFDDSVGTARIAVPRHAEAARIDHELVADFENVGFMGVAHTDNV